MRLLAVLCATLAGTVLVLVAILGPVYAFVLISCESTRSCIMGVDLHDAGGTCAEGGGQRSESMLHGETCTVLCPAGLVPTTPQIVCNDGLPVGLSTLACLPPAVAGIIVTSGSLVPGAVTTGETRDACMRAQRLQCSAPIGGSAVFLNLPDLTEDTCRSLYLECRALNSGFDYMQFTNSTSATLGTCTMGCFQEIVPTEALAAVAFNDPLTQKGGLFAGATSSASTIDNLCNDGPMCLAVSGSCNEPDNGDYYRYPTCASGYTQWVTQNKSHRIRYDGTPAYSQSGKWILEQDADPGRNAYGLQLGRQPSFALFPLLGTQVWNFRCRRKVGILTWQESFRQLQLTLGPCSCTDEQDCSGNGQAYGSKDQGPNCKCNCKRGFAGDHCEIPLCKVPDVLNALEPPCAEGRWLTPNQICTPMCSPGYAATYKTFTCGANGTWPADKVFTCIPKITDNNAVAVNLGGYEEGQATTTLRPACSARDCSYRGEANGLRYLNGTCICVCFEEFAGIDCRGWKGHCEAPVAGTIDNAYPNTCKEGGIVNAPQCTAQCAFGYYPIPATLECRGTELAPPVFRCFAETPVRQEWCQMMKYISIAGSSAAVVGLCAMCCCFGRTPSREVRAFFAAGQLVEVAQDEEGKYNLVRNDQKDMRTKLPRHVTSTVTPLEYILPVAPEARPLSAPSAMEDAERELALRSEVRPESPSSDALRRLADATEAPSLPGEVQAIAAFPDVTDWHPTGSVEEEPEFYPGQHVALSGLLGHPALNGAQGLLVEFDENMGMWAVELEGYQEGIKHVPVRHLQALQLAIHDAARARTDWLMEKRALEEKAEAARHEHELKVRERRGAGERATTAANLAILDATAAERAAAEAGMRDALAAGDAEALRAAATKGRQLLGQVAGAPAPERASLTRLVELSESRLEQHAEREASIASKRRHEERVERGEAPDWKMEPADFWRYAEEGDAQKVRAGCRAMLPLSTRSTDGKRLTIVHVACRSACADGIAGGEAMTRRLDVVGTLVKARANANAVDAADRTPLDLAVCEGGEEASATPGAAAILEALRKLGLRTAAEELEELRAAAASKAAAPGARSTPAPGRR